MEVTRTRNHTLLLHGKSDIGMVREENQDAFSVQLPPDPEQEEARGRLVVLADGMGGLAHGGRASRIAVEHVSSTYFETEGAHTDALIKAVAKANREIYREAQELPGNQPMGSTITAMALVGGGAVVAQVGDSRAYRISNERGIEQVTRDHTLVQELADRGEIEPDSLHYLLNRNVLTRGLGLQEEIDVDLFEIDDLAIGDTFLLCSDGLYDVVADSEIENHVLSYGDAIEDLVNYLIELARSRGAPDNVTVVVARVGSDAAAGSSPRAAGGGAPGGEDGPERVSLLQPLVYFGLFALGAILTLLLLDRSSPERSAREILEHPRLEEYMQEHPDSPLRRELERFREWQEK